MIYYVFLTFLILLHFPIFRKKKQKYIFLFASLSIIIGFHIGYIYSLVPEYWKHISDENYISTFGPDTLYYMTLDGLIFHAFMVSWLTISLLGLIEIILNKIIFYKDKFKLLKIFSSFIISGWSIYFLMYDYFVDSFIQSANQPGFEFVQHSYLFFIDVLLFVFFIQWIWYKQDNNNKKEIK